jgi:uncharacterized membrane protein YheB (UPF0754 family)
MVEQISPILIALAGLLGGGGFIAVLSWLISSEYRKKRISEWTKQAAQADFDTSKIRLEGVKNEQDQFDWLLEKLKDVKVKYSGSQASVSILTDRIDRLIAENTMKNTRLIYNLEEITKSCTCDAKNKFDEVIQELKKENDA